MQTFDRRSGIHAVRPRRPWQRRLPRTLWHLSIATILTLVSQVGGLAWLMALPFRWRGLAFPAIYTILSLTAWAAAPGFGRAALPCTGETLRSATLVTCALNRHYVDPRLLRAAEALAASLAIRHPGTVVETLDAGFPLPMPMIPHLSHGDGRRLDIALWWRGPDGYASGLSPSPIGYFGYADGPDACTPRALDLRWDWPWLQRLLPAREPDLERLAAALRFLQADDRISRVLVEPHLARAAGVEGGKIRFAGCGAARHDDHIHVEL